MIDSLHWFCVHTRPAKELLAVQYCEEILGAEAYFPKLRTQKVIRRRRREVVEALFPRYFFCRFRPADHLRAVRYAPDVIDIVSFGGRPAIVDDSIIATVRSWAGEALDIESVRPSLQPGDAVRITQGPFQGIGAIFQRKTSNPDRVEVLLSVLSTGARLTIDDSALERVA